MLCYGCFLYGPLPPLARARRVTIKRFDFWGVQTPTLDTSAPPELPGYFHVWLLPWKYYRSAGWNFRQLITAAGIDNRER